MKGFYNKSVIEIYDSMPDCKQLRAEKICINKLTGRDIPYLESRVPPSLQPMCCAQYDAKELCKLLMAIQIQLIPLSSWKRANKQATNNQSNELKFSALIRVNGDKNSIID